MKDEKNHMTFMFKRPLMRKQFSTEYKASDDTVEVSNAFGSKLFPCKEDFSATVFVQSKQLCFPEVRIYC